MPVSRPAARHAAASLPSNRVLCNSIGSITRAVDRYGVFPLAGTPLTSPFEDDVRTGERERKKAEETRVNILALEDRVVLDVPLLYRIFENNMILVIEALLVLFAYSRKVVFTNPVNSVFHRRNI